MTFEEVRRGVEEVRAARGDDEQAHSLEDELHRKVLLAIATGECGGSQPADLAAIALETLDIEFARWCA